MSIEISDAPILVTGATGRQGGAVARALLKSGASVRALVRDPGAESAREVAELGAKLVSGDLRDIASLHSALKGARGVFSVQMPDADDPEGELAQAGNLIGAAREVGVGQFVHTSVTGAGQHRSATGWADGRWASMESYFESKSAIQELVRQSGFVSWTILKPAFFMENIPFLMPGGPAGGLATIIRPETMMVMVSVADIGSAAAAAFAEPRRFAGVELELAGDYLSMAQIASALSRATGVEIAAPTMTAAEALEAGMPTWGLGHEWHDEVGQPARPSFAASYGIATTCFESWLDAHVSQLGG